MNEIRKVLTIPRDEFLKLHELLDITDFNALSQEDKDRLGIKKDAVVLSHSVDFPNNLIVDFDIICGAFHAFINIQAYERDEEGQVFDPFFETTGSALGDEIEVVHKETNTKLILEVKAEPVYALLTLAIVYDGEGADADYEKLKALLTHNIETQIGNGVLSGDLDVTVENYTIKVTETNPQDEIALGWCVSDVLEVRPGLTVEQARDVLADVEADHDASRGVNWETFENSADRLYPNVAHPDTEEEAVSE